MSRTAQSYPSVISGSKGCVLVTDAKDQTTTYTYEPFGKTTITGTSGNPFQFTGREQEGPALSGVDGTGLYYHRARYYQPRLQRFLSQDLIGLAGGINLYRYAGNNPVQFGDPFGLCRIDVRFSRAGLVANHAYIVTTDTNGSQSYYRGGPTNTSSAAFSSDSSGSLGGRRDKSNPVNSPFGPIKTQYGEYVPGTPDWDPDNSPSMTILNNNEACGPFDQRFEETMKNIGNANISYWPLSTNSNATARETLNRSGFNPGVPPVWAPGWSTPLP